MSETSFKIKCSKSSSARRFSLSKPTIASLGSHVAASWGASGPSFWYVDDDGDRIEVMDDNDFQAATSQLKSSCVCLNVDFVSDQIEFKSSKSDDTVPSNSASSESSHDDDGFISVELHVDSSVQTPLPSVVVADVAAASEDVEKHATEGQERDLDQEQRLQAVQAALSAGFGIDGWTASGLNSNVEVEAERQNQSQQAADVEYRLKIANAIEDMVVSSGMGFTSDSFRAAVESSDPASLKQVIRNALFLGSCFAQVQEIAQTAIKRIEKCMTQSVHVATATETNIQCLMQRLSISDMPHSDLHAWLKYQATREQLSCLSVPEERHLKSYAAKAARDERREQKLAAKLERHLMTRPSAEQLKQAHIIMEPVEARAAALERVMIAQRLEKDLSARHKVASRFAGCVVAGHALSDPTSADYAHQCHQAQTLRQIERAQVAATIERNLVARHSLRELKKAHIVVAPVEARAAALERTMNAQRLEKDLARSKVAPRNAGYAWTGRSAEESQEVSPVQPAASDQSLELDQLHISRAQLAGPNAPSQDVQRYQRAFATLGSMGFGQGEDVRLAVYAHNGDINAIVQHILG